MSFRIYGQHDPAYAGHVLGWGPNLGTIGQFGCLDCVIAMIANDSGFPNDPVTTDEALTAGRFFKIDPTGTFDFIPDNALDLLYPGRYHSTGYGGFRTDLIDAAIPTADTYAYVGVSWNGGANTHFVLVFSKGPNYLIADPETGAVNYLSNYTKFASVFKTVIVQSLPAPAPVPVPTPVPTPLPPNPNKSLKWDQAIWIPSPNFTADRRDAADPPTEASYDLSKGYDIIFHSEAGYEAGTIVTFQNPNPPGGPRSAHFSIALDGSKRQYVDLKDCAWDAGIFEENRQSVGIEHEDFNDPTGIARTDAQIKSSAETVAWIESQLGKARSYKRHKEIVPTTCPGNLPVELIVSVAHGGPMPTPPVPNPTPLPIPPTPNPAPSPVPSDALPGLLQNILIYLLKAFLGLLGRTK